MALRSAKPGKARRQPSRNLLGLLRRARPTALNLAALLMALAALPAQADIKAARYTDPTDRYGHGVLGDAGEYATLEVTLTSGRRVAVHWPDTIVFEDTAPRLVDLTGDGKPEIITVQSHDRRGAQVAIYQYAEGALSLAAANPFIGTRFRWLAIVGAADLDGDGTPEIAYVDRPHLAKTLRILRFEQLAENRFSLTGVASKPGLTNHRIGEDFITGGIRNCDGLPEMITASANWSRVQASSFGGTSISTRDLGPFSQSAIARSLACQTP